MSHVDTTGIVTEPWEGMAYRVGESFLRVMKIAEGRVYSVEPATGSIHGGYDPSRSAVAIDDRPTRLEFMARLAERLGASSESADYGVRFVREWSGACRLEVGARKFAIVDDSDTVAETLVRAWIAAGEAG